MPRPPRTWKHAERAIARLLGGRRCHFEGQDVECEQLSVEVKHGRQIPRTLLKWWEQAEGNARDGNRPLLVLHPLGTNYRDSLAVLSLADLAELLGARAVPDEAGDLGTQRPPAPKRRHNRHRHLN